MKYILTILVMTFSICVHSQVFPIELETVWDFKDESQKVIVITYDLDDIEDLRYLKIIAKAYVDDRLIPLRSLRGDIGEAVKVGNAKTIEWNWENDVVEIAGELRFVVTADNPIAVEEVSADNSSKVTKPEIPLRTLLALPVGTGGSLMLTGMISSLGAKSGWNDLNGSDRTQEEYDDYNRKHKTGQWIAIGGAAIVVAGVIWYIKEKAVIASYSGRLSVEPGYGNLTYISPEKTTNYSTIGMSLNFKF